jgi:hypothetical protein
MVSLFLRGKFIICSPFLVIHKVVSKFDVRT